MRFVRSARRRYTTPVPREFVVVLGREEEFSVRRVGARGQRNVGPLRRKDLRRFTRKDVEGDRERAGRRAKARRLALSWCTARSCRAPEARFADEIATIAQYHDGEIAVSAHAGRGQGLDCRDAAPARASRCKQCARAARNARRSTII